jgi:hypothetical protein
MEEEWERGEEAEGKEIEITKLSNANNTFNYKTN